VNVTNVKLKEEMEEREQAVVVRHKSDSELQAQNRKLVKVHEFVGFTLRNVTNSMRRGASNNEVINALEQAQRQFDRIDESS
jgi:hypothetical protein